MYWYGHDMGWWGYVDVALLMAVFWILVIGSLAALVKYLFASGSAKGRTTREPGSPAEVLAVRFARGEIDESEYRERVAVLGECGRHPEGSTDRLSAK
ncbi:SHOCT domain-containing protein [Mycobacterium hodleri]|uniref:SHOCT domain-containing protein n=2 Tax=Mycolicibacterium hodleri TaxID=49897 RepID=A0A544W0G0_9MYCO|nr:SHOCT domain-containing protein [Mycolicibacterium hodleri]